ncbi:DMT family transporter [Variovorax boronicumulans]|uniref:DMT family transporter n=1 Tax=Variovorax boronicumulans TaxID=436515 RepID=UPI0033918D0D
MSALPRFSPRTLGIGAAVVTVLVWTAFIVIARASAGRSLTPFDLAFARICGASLVLVPWGAWLVARHRGAASSLFGLSPLSLRITAVAGVFGGLAYAMLAYSGFFFAPAGHASVLMPGSLPLWTTLLAALVLRDRITPMRAIGLAMIVAGDLVVGGRSLLQAFDGGEVWKGDLLFMSAAFCWACYSVVARRHGLDAVRATIAITVFALVTYVPAYSLLVAGGWVASHIGTAPWGEVAFQMLFQGVGSVVISGITFTRMIQYFGPVRSTMITALVPGLSAFGAVLWLDEPLYWNLVAGLLLVTAGILFGVQKTAGARMAPVVAAAAVGRANNG